MLANPKISDFIERAKSNGIADEALVGMLSGRGWSEKEVYEALAVHYERQTGMEIPLRGGGGTAARDAFLYLLAFSTLATWTIGLASLAFSLIDRSLVDTLSTLNYQYDNYGIAESLASIIVAFPIYLLVSRIVVRESAAHPEKQQSPVRKWLTYMALIIAAGCFIGDLVTVLSFFLRGEITSRFLAKALVVLVLSGGVFLYYYGGLRRAEESGGQGRMIPESWMAGLASLLVVAMLVWGFASLGAPKTQRALRSDAMRVQSLYQLSVKIHAPWNVNSTLERKLPPTLDDLQGVQRFDPFTHDPYEYHTKAGTQYELCATFYLSSQQDESHPSIWSHPAGHYCFSLDAATDAEAPNVYYWQ